MKELYQAEKGEKMQYVTTYIRKLEDSYLKLMEYPQHVDLIIKTCRFCLEKNDFNIACILYSCINTKLIKKPDLLNGKKSWQDEVDDLGKILSASGIAKNYKDAFQKAPSDMRIPILSEWFRIMAVNETIETIQEGKLNGWKMKALHNSIKNYEMIRSVHFNFEVIYSIKEFLSKLPFEEIPETLYFPTPSNNPFDIQIQDVITNILNLIPNASIN